MLSEGKGSQVLESKKKDARQYSDWDYRRKNRTERCKRNREPTARVPVLFPVPYLVVFLKRKCVCKRMTFVHGISEDCMKSPVDLSVPSSAQHGKMPRCLLHAASPL